MTTNEIEGGLSVAMICLLSSSIDATQCRPLLLAKNNTDVLAFEGLVTDDDGSAKQQGRPTIGASNVNAPHRVKYLRCR